MGAFRLCIVGVPSFLAVVFMGDRAEYLRRAEEAQTNAKWACDLALRQYWEDVARIYRNLSRKPGTPFRGTTSDVLYRRSAQVTAVRSA